MYSHINQSILSKYSYFLRKFKKYLAFTPDKFEHRTQVLNSSVKSVPTVVRLQNVMYPTPFSSAADRNENPGMKEIDPGVYWGVA